MKFLVKGVLLVKVSKVIVPQPKNPDYYEYLWTGFHNLAQQDSIQEFQMNNRNVFTRINEKIRKHILKENIQEDWLTLMIEVVFKDKVIKVAIDVRDTPWEFNESILNQCDLYFKYQCPIDLEKGYFNLNENNTFKFSAKVQDNLNKIRPLLIARPLGRKFDFNENNLILKTYQEMRDNTQRPINLLAYLGNCFDDYALTKAHHPHLKRVSSMVFLNDLNRDDVKIVYRPTEQAEFLKDLPADHVKLPAYTGRINDEQYREWCNTSKSTLNIAGLRGSIPFRFMDAFLSGMLIITDTPLVKWYVPLRNEQEILDIGRLAYDVLSEGEFFKAMERLKGNIENIDKLRREMIPYQNDFYQRYLSPEKVCHYIIEECFKIV